MALDKKTTVLVEKLHKNVGVRTSHLPTTLAGTELARRWNIGKEDSSLTVRAKLIYRVEETLRDCTAKQQTVAPILYNTITDVDLYDVQYMKRVDVAMQRHPEIATSLKTMERLVDDIDRELKRSVEAGAAQPLPFDDLHLSRIANREQAFEREIVRRGSLNDFDRLIQAGYQSPMTPAHHRFMDETVLVPLSSTDQFVVALTPIGGWICVFRTIDDLTRHRAATLRRAPVHRVVEKRGGDLVREVVALRKRIGIVYNPVPPRTEDVSRTLALHHDALVELARIA